MLAWMDLEMTGLDPDQDLILEIATLITDNDLELIAVGPDLIIHVDEAEFFRMDKVVLEMHKKSGLLSEVRASQLSLEEAGRQTLEFLQAHISEPGSVPLCGNSIGMDRRFLAKHLNEIEEFLDYRSVDVSTVKELAKRWLPDVYAAAPEKAKDHRAMDDIIESLEELRFYRHQIFAL